MRGAAVLALCILADCAQAENRFSEFAVKAAYLFNFGKFIRYTSADELSGRQTFDICIVGEDPFGHTLDDLTANERLDDKAVRVERVRTASAARSCSIAFISAAEGKRIESDLESLRGQPVLTVSDAPDFLQRGGMIQFITTSNHVRFSVNLFPVRNAKLSLSSELLKVAESVQEEAPAGVRP